MKLKEGLNNIRRNSGTSLVEVMVAFVIISVMSLTFASCITVSSGLVVRGAEIINSSFEAEKTMEQEIVNNSGSTVQVGITIDGAERTVQVSRVISPVTATLSYFYYGNR